MGSLKEREMRQTVHLKARLHWDAGWFDATIRNVSTRGLMMETLDPPPKGTFVEIRRGSCCIIGQVRWVHGARFGIRSQDRINARALMEEPQGKPQSGDRRAEPRDTAAPRPQVTTASRHEQSRQLSRLIEWSALGIAVLIGAAVLTSQVSAILSRPLEQVRLALAGGDSQ